MNFFIRSAGIPSSCFHIQRRHTNIITKTYIK